jgi:hypothetical protein
MTQTDDEFGDLPELTNRELLRILMGEIVDTRNELKQEFKDELTRVDCRIDALAVNLLTLASEVHTLRLEVHQNQSAFIGNNAALDKRVTTLEGIVFR